MMKASSSIGFAVHRNALVDRVQVGAREGAHAQSRRLQSALVIVVVVPLPLVPVTWIVG